MAKANLTDPALKMLEDTLSILHETSSQMEVFTTIFVNKDLSTEHNDALLGLFDPDSLDSIISASNRNIKHAVAQMCELQALIEFKEKHGCSEKALTSEIA